ncbi:MAG TPA: carbon-nitrogen hydrolase family protein [Candidatus Latescibacteria bacterium]|nr:carbon-nitrogen hydrolase family protein [Candidatus Latescibacterota bacterium]
MNKTARHSPFRVASVQFRSAPHVERNVARIVEHLHRLSQQGVRAAAFPECAVTSYDEKAIRATTPEQLSQAEREISTACRENGISVVVGIPYWEHGTLYNGALAFDSTGKCVARYAKIQLAGEKWCASGTRFAMFNFDSVPCSVIICHDERYPELVRLPVLAGAQIIFYISCESDITAETKIAPYRAQIQARAMENSVFVVHANAPMGNVRMRNGKPRGEAAGSNGHSRIIKPDGNIVAEASIWGEDVLVADLDMSLATRHLALRSLQSPLLRSWWEAGLRLVPPPTR